MKENIIKLFVFIIVLCGVNAVFAQNKSNADIKKFKEEAVQLINLPEPTFKPMKFVAPSPQAIAEMGFEQVYPNKAVEFQLTGGKKLSAYHFEKESELSVILVHGVLSSAFLMNKTAGLLRETMNAEVFAVDLRGHGQSEGKPGDVDFIDQYAADLADVVKKIRKDKPKGKIILAGHSMGGGISLRYTQNKAFPKVDGYLLFAPLLGQNAPTIPQSSAAAAESTEEPFLKINIQRLIGLKMLNSIGITEHNGLNVLFFNLPSEMPLKNYSYRANESMAPADYKAGLKAIKKPLLVLVGSKDEAFVASTFERAVKENSKGEIHIIEGVSHNGIRTNSEALKKIKDWSQKHF